MDARLLKKVCLKPEETPGFGQKDGVFDFSNKP